MVWARNRAVAELSLKRRDRLLQVSRLESGRDCWLAQAPMRLSGWRLWK